MGLIVVALTLPPMFRFGVERGRMFFVLAVIVLACGGAGITQELSGVDVSGLPGLLILAGFPLLALGLSLVSVPLSCALMKKQRLS